MRTSGGGRAPEIICGHPTYLAPSRRDAENAPLMPRKRPYRWAHLVQMLYGARAVCSHPTHGVGHSHMRASRHRLPRAPRLQSLRRLSS